VVLVAVSLALVSAVSYTVAGGENFGIPLAELPIPFDKCSVAAANDANMHLTAVAWGYNNEYWMTQQSDNWGPFSNWTSIGGFFAGGPTVIRNANNNIVVFGRGADQKVWYNVFYAGVALGWTPLGGKLLSGGITALVDPEGLIHVFARGKDSAIWEKREFANGTEAAWGDWTSLGGIMSGNVAAVLDAEGLINLFARGIDGRMWWMTQSLAGDGSLNWASWQKAENGVLLASAATISASLNAQNLIEVVVRGADKAFWHTRQTVDDERGVAWSPWKSLGGIFSSAPSFEINSDQLLTVYGRGPEKGVWYKQQAHHPIDSPSDSWSQWVPLGGRFSAGVDAIPDSRGYINLFGRGLDNALWTRSQVYANQTVGFFGPWSNLGGRFRAFPC